MRKKPILESSRLSETHYLKFLEEAKQKIKSSRIQVAKAACQQQIQLYWWLGSQITRAQKEYGWGKSVVEQLSKDLKQHFGGSYGFSTQNLWYMRQFYLVYKDYPNLQRLVGDLPWGQNLLILSKVKDLKAREYYLRLSAEQGWTRSILQLQIESQAYERQILPEKQHNFRNVLSNQLAEQADQAMKDVYMLDTLGLTEPVLENLIEKRMVEKIKAVMLELGYGFTFVGNQYRLMPVGGSECFIDLLFFNRQLRCLVAVELKTGKFKPEYAGKMNYYLNLLDDLVKEKWENPSIGIILCTDRNQVDVEYTLRGISKPVGVSEFRLTKKLPSELIGKLPQVTHLESKILKELGIKQNESRKKHLKKRRVNERIG